MQKKKNICEDLIEYLYYKKLEIIVSPNIFLVSSKRSNSSKGIIETSIFVFNFNYRNLFSYFSNESFLPWE